MNKSIGTPGAIALMQRQGSGYSDPDTAVEEQPHEHPLNVFICRCFEGLVSKIEGLIYQFAADVFIHRIIFSIGYGWRNS